MRHKQHETLAARGLLARAIAGMTLGVACMGAQASDAMAIDEPLESSMTAMADQAPARNPSPIAGMAVDDDELSGRRGGAATQNDVRLDGVVGSNEATNTISGANTISSGAFSGAAGLPMVIQNSGSNVLIQNATIVNVQIK